MSIASPAAPDDPGHQLTAAGTLRGEPANLARRVWLFIELLLLFVAAPLAMDALVHQQRIPLFVALLPVLLVVVLILIADSTFQLRRELSRSFGWRTALTIMLTFAIGGAGVAYWVHEVHPAWFMELPRERPETWKRVMLIYPIGSVLTQELIYRTFYFHRYGPLFGRQIRLALLLNALLFGLGHVVVGTEFALISTSVTGLLFAVRYYTARSFWAVWLEHTLWGWLVFTIGLNRYFFTGIANF